MLPFVDGSCIVRILALSFWDVLLWWCTGDIAQQSRALERVFHRPSCSMAFCATLFHHEPYQLKKLPKSYNVKCRKICKR